MSLLKDKFDRVNSAFTSETNSIVVATAQLANDAVTKKLEKEIDKADKNHKKAKKAFNQWADGKTLKFDKFKINKNC